MQCLRRCASQSKRSTSLRTMSHHLEAYLSVQTPPGKVCHTTYLRFDFSKMMFWVAINSSSVSSACRKKKSKVPFLHLPLYSFWVKYSTSHISCKDGLVRLCLSSTQALKLKKCSHLSSVCFFFSRQYLAEKVPNTNLVLIISDRQQGNSQSCGLGPLIQDEKQCIL